MNGLSTLNKSCCRLLTTKAKNGGVFLTPKISLPEAPTHFQSISRFTPTLIDGQYPSSPSLRIPPNIIRPPYAESGSDRIPPASVDSSYGEIKTTEAIASMRAAGRIAGQALQLAVELTEPGVTGTEVERKVHDFIISQHAYPSPLHFHGFPKSLVISVNEACCHGIPNHRPYQNGDVIKYDCVVYFDGYHGDCAATVGVGDGLSPERQMLIQSCRTARDEAIKLCKPGTPLNQLGQCISDIAKNFNFGIVEVFCGHFIGREMHMMPLVPHVQNDNKYELLPGNCLTIEPIFTEGSTELASWRDGWTVVTRDFGFSSQWEHTILITDSGAEILTPLV